MGIRIIFKNDSSALGPLSIHSPAHGGLEEAL
jgi:hypothetical protein